MEDQSGNPFAESPSQAEVRTRLYFQIALRGEVRPTLTTNGFTANLTFWQFTLLTEF
jgi:hypothetical protein